jgi:hypothetical protein
MKIAAVIPLVLLLAGCAAREHSYYKAERAHTMREQAIAESNRFPTPGNRDSYYWYQKNTERNTPVGGHPGSDYHWGPAPGFENDWGGGGYPGYYAPYGYYR